MGTLGVREDASQHGNLTGESGGWCGPLDWIKLLKRFLFCSGWGVLERPEGSEPRSWSPAETVECSHDGYSQGLRGVTSD